jgi:transmembrane sensor
MVTDIYEILGRHFRNEISPDEKLYLEQWLESDENKCIFNEVEKAWKYFASIKASIKPDIDKEWERFNQLKVNPSALSYLEEKKNPVTLNLRNWGLYAAAVLLIGLTIYASYKILKPTSENINLIAVISANETKEVTLPDGSVITLNKTSTIQYPENFSKNNRQVILNGEAYFEVTKGKGTFTVNTGKTITTVLGTKFNIKARTDNELTELYVTEGKVMFAATGAPNKEIFTIGEQGIINNRTGTLIHDKIDNPNRIAWKTGNLTFNNCKMSEVQSTLCGYFQKVVMLEPGLKDLLLTGNFSKPQLNELLEVVSVSLAVDCKERNDSVFISSQH